MMMMVYIFQERDSGKNAFASAAAASTTAKKTTTTTTMRRKKAKIQNRTRFQLELVVRCEKETTANKKQALDWDCSWYSWRNFFFFLSSFLLYLITHHDDVDDAVRYSTSWNKSMALTLLWSNRCSII